MTMQSIKHPNADPQAGSLVRASLSRRGPARANCLPGLAIPALYHLEDDGDGPLDFPIDSHRDLIPHASFGTRNGQRHHGSLCDAPRDAVRKTIRSDY